MMLFTFDSHNLNISTDRQKEWRLDEIYCLSLRRIQCRNRILIFHLITTKANVGDTAVHWDTGYIGTPYIS